MYLFQLASFLASIPKLGEMYRFYTHLLGVPDVSHSAQTRMESCVVGVVSKEKTPHRRGSVAMMSYSPGSRSERRGQAVSDDRVQWAHAAGRLVTGTRDMLHDRLPEQEADFKADIQTLPWPEIVRLIGEIRKHNPVTSLSGGRPLAEMTGEEAGVVKKLDAHDIAK